MGASFREASQDVTCRTCSGLDGHDGVAEFLEEQESCSNAVEPWSGGNSLQMQLPREEERK